MEEYQPDQIPDKYLIAIGKVALRWNLVENLLNSVLVEMIGGDMFTDLPYAPFIHMSVRNKLQTLETIMDAMKVDADTRISKSFRIAIPLVERAGKKRNEIIHSMWLISEGRVAYQSVHAQGKITMRRVLVDIEHVNDAIELIGKSQEALWELLIWASAAHRPAPQSGQKGNVSEALKKASSEV